MSVIRMSGPSSDAAPGPSLTQRGQWVAAAAQSQSARLTANGNAGNMKRRAFITLRLHRQLAATTGGTRS